MMCVVVNRVSRALSGSLWAGYLVISDEISIGVCVGSVFVVCPPVSLCVCNVSGLSFVCCAMYCVLGC